MKNRTSRFLPPEKEGSLISTDFFGFLADIDRREPLAAQLEGDQALGLGMNGAGANLSIGSDGSEVKISHAAMNTGDLRSSVSICGHLEFLRDTHHLVRRWLRRCATLSQPSSRRLRIPLRRATFVMDAASSFFMISCRISSSSSISSKMPMRPV